MTKPKTVLEIVRQYLKTNGYDGLYNEDGQCACLLDDLHPCGEYNDISECSPGYKYVCDGKNCNVDVCEPERGQDNWHVGATKPRPKRDLGKVQAGVLSAIVEHGKYSEWCGWTWSTHSATIRVVRSLEIRGLVKREPGPNCVSIGSTTNERWVPTAEGDAWYKNRVMPQHRSGRGQRL
jgi:hypothetical protein